MSCRPLAKSFDLEAGGVDASDYWSPKIVARLNDQYVTVVDLAAGAMHKPIADEEYWIVPIKPVQTKRTAHVDSPLTRTIKEQLCGSRQTHSSRRMAILDPLWDIDQHCLEWPHRVASRSHGAISAD
jgi:hypothetical protein